VWNPERWHRLYNRIDSFRASRQPALRQPVPAPRLDVYIGGGAIVWDRVEVPGQLVVIDKREESAPVQPVGGGLVRGDIFDMCTGKPIPGAHIALVGVEGQADRQNAIHGTADDLGAFQIEKIPAGRYEITVRADGYASRRLGPYGNKGSTYHTLVTHLARESSIKGVVTDVEGNGISGVEVHATDIFGIDGQDYPSVDAHPAITDAQGRFEVRSLPVGFVQLRCRAASMHLATSTCEICEVPGERLKLTMEGTGRIRGKVVDKYGDVPPGELHVHVRPVGELLIGTWGGSARCEEDGSFDFAEVPPGRYLVGTNFMLLHEDRDPNAKPVSIEPGTTVELEIVHDVPVKPH
ncbi:MAG: carboxypeptidase regulatory-like domain-containing protein, partial [Armatimonadota bacterium]